MLVQTKNQVSDLKVGCASDCRIRLGADVLAFKEILEKMQDFFLGPLAEVSRIGLAHSAWRGCELLNCIVYSSLSR